MATYTFQGTQVYKEGDFKISGAQVGNTYLNKQSGNVYSCTELHTDWQSPGWSKWVYTRTDIIAKPNQGVAGLGAPTRNPENWVMTAKWVLYDWQRNTKNGKRMTGQRITWRIETDQKNTKGQNIVYSVVENKSISTVQSVLNLNNFKPSGASAALSRLSFYPNQPRKITNLSCTVETKNDKGYGPAVKGATKFYKPRAPILSDFSFDPQSGNLTLTVTTDAGTDLYERYDTYIEATVQNTYRGDTKAKPLSGYPLSTRSTTYPVTYNVADLMALGYDDYILVTVRATARGLAGNSATASKQYYISYPAQTSILDTKISSEEMSGKCTVFIDTNQHTDKQKQHPVDHVKLEYLANVEYSDPALIPGDVDWKATNIVDDAQCTALSVAVTELIPDQGKYTWLRVKSWHMDEDRLFRYSECVSVMHQEASTAQDDTIAIISAEAGKDGKSIVVVLGWEPQGHTDDATGTELSWSDELDTWESTKTPESYQFTWFKNQSVTKGSVTYQKSARLTIKGLSEGEMYYIKARRYLESDVITYSDYSDHASCMTGEIPESIVATADKFIAAGSALPVYWTFSGNGMQTEWQIRSVTNAVNAYARSGVTALSSAWLSLTNGGSALTPSTDKIYILMQDSNGYAAGTQFEWDETENEYAVCDKAVILVSGEGSTGFAQIPAERLAAHAEDGSLMIRVEAAAGSEFINSEWQPVNIVEAPELTIDVDSTLTAQPLSFDAAVSTLCDLIVIVSSNGASGQLPTGIVRQTVGDTIHSDVYQPGWVEDNDEFTATVTIPTGMDFWNGGTYTLTVIAVDRSTGLRSETIENTISIAWAQEAVDPFGYVTLTPIDTTDDTGQHRKAVQIALTPPQNAAGTDVYDIYRLSGDGAQLIGDGFPLTYTTVDEYAPFGDDLTLYYRIAIRTQDGDVAYSDFEYNANGGYLRFDWDGNILELPYDITIQDGYKKNVDIRQHMDGSSDGYWNKNIERTGSLSTDVIRLEQATEIDLAKQLARYPGVVFVRTPDGSAYEADVQVSDMSVQSRNITSIAIDATEVGLTQEFMLPIPEEEEE